MFCKCIDPQEDTVSLHCGLVLQVHQRHAISEDTWRQVLEFSRSVHEDLSNYDPEGEFFLGSLHNSTVWASLCTTIVNKVDSLSMQGRGQSWWTSLLTACTGM